MLHTDNIDTGKVFKMSYNKLKPFLSIFTAAALHKPINNSSFLKYFSYILLVFIFTNTFLWSPYGIGQSIIFS